MRTYWWRHPSGERNFGDLLTELLLRDHGIDVRWSRPDQAELFAIGSLLEKVPPGYRGAIWSSGQLHRDTRTDLTEATVLAVRGHLTLAAMTCREPSGVVLGDGALLCRKFAGRSPKRYQLGIIAHQTDRADPRVAAWAAFGPEVTVIDVTADPWQTLLEIDRCRAILSSSLHGLIVADALSIPNRWLLLSDRVLGDGFKFHDYWSGVDKSPQQPWRPDPRASLDELLAAVTGDRPPPGIDRRVDALAAGLKELARIDRRTWAFLSRPVVDTTAEHWPTARTQGLRLVRAARGLPQRPATWRAVVDRIERLAPQVDGALRGALELLRQCSRSSTRSTQGAMEIAPVEAAFAAIADPGEVTPGQATAEPLGQLLATLAARAERHAALTRALAAVERQAWQLKTQRVQQELDRLSASGHRVLLIDGAELAVQVGGNVRPFPERDGHYDGPPPDDPAALIGLSRAIAAGATAVVLAFNAQWWREHYPALVRQLQRQFDVTVDDGSATVFEQRRTADGERRTANGGRRTTDDGRRTTDDERRTTDDERRTTNDGRRTTDHERRTTDDGPRTTDHGDAYLRHRVSRLRRGSLLGPGCVHPL